MEDSFCRVCLSINILDFQCIDDKQYYRCNDCLATQLSIDHLPSREEEYRHYLQHENETSNPRYRAFLARLATPLMGFLPEDAEGLDYGCGPGPALAMMLNEAGFAMETHDPQFSPNPLIDSRRFDFITCTETVEHFHQPAMEFARLRQMLRPNGYLAIMTCFQTDDDKFGNWHYRRDPTHVVFYKQETFEFLAKKWRYTIHIPRKDVVIMQCPSK